MMELFYNLVIIGGGPAGMAAAIKANKLGIDNILLLERDRYLGGILQQCIHNGFGLEYFKEELTGPEYAQRFIDLINNSSIKVMTETMVFEITKEKQIVALNRKVGIISIKAKAIILAMGCRERTRESLLIPGDRPAGIFTAGTAQRYINIEGYMPGKEVVILGSGDIGMIMARRLTLEGANVKAVLEIKPYTSGLIRNKVQCLDDFDIPLKLQHTVTKINGKKRIESVIISRVDENLKPIPGTKERIKCDTLLLSVGLIPENELSTKMGIRLNKVTGGPLVNEIRETNIEGVFACGNVLHVHDMVDYVTEEGEITGMAAWHYLSNNIKRRYNQIKIIPGYNIRYVVPQIINYILPGKKGIKIFFRVKKPLENVRISILNDNNDVITSYQRELVTPGKMERIFLPEGQLNKEIKNVTLTLSEKEDKTNV